MASVTPSNVSMRQHNQYEIEQSKQGRFPHKRPLPYRKKGTEQEIHSDAERSGAIQKAAERTFPITSAACRWAVVVTWA